MKLTGIIGIAGNICSGKSTQARYLTTRTNWHRRGFATALKEDVCQWLGVKETAENKHLLRPLYQAYGTYRRLHDGEDYWVERLRTWVNDEEESGDLTGVLVIDDVRYRNEVLSLRDWGRNRGIPVAIIKLTTDELIQGQRHQHIYKLPLDRERMEHISEHDLDGFTDFDLVHDTTNVWPVTTLGEILWTLVNKEFLTTNSAAHLWLQVMQEQWK